jgi:hypothetical protein
MNVQELLTPIVLFEDVSSSNIKMELQKVKKDMENLMLRGGSLGHGSVLPQYMDQMNRLKARQKSLRDQLTLSKTHSSVQQELGSDWQKSQAERMANPMDRANRNSEAISTGLQQGHQLRKELGGYDGIAQDILKNIRALTENGTKPLEFEVLSNKYGVNIRTLHKWFERPEFMKLRRFMPHMYR